MRYIILISSMVLAIAGQILLKRGIMVSTISANIGDIIKTLFSSLIFFGFLLYGISSLLWLLVLKNFPLSIAAPTLSLSYVFLFIYGMIFLGEKITAANVVGLVCIVIGVLLISVK